MKFFILLPIVFILSCSKEKSCEKCTENNNSFNATIVYSGPVETDGCGWLVRIDSTHLYHPDLLDSAFQHDQLEVKITYDLTSGKYICGIAALQLPIIHITSIKR